jgi:hypothetical protein
LMSISSLRAANVNPVDFANVHHQVAAESVLPDPAY